MTKQRVVSISSLWQKIFSVIREYVCSKFGLKQGVSSPYLINNFKRLVRNVNSLGCWSFVKSSESMVGGCLETLDMTPCSRNFSQFLTFPFIKKEQQLVSSITS